MAVAVSRQLRARRRQCRRHRFDPEDRRDREFETLGFGSSELPAMATLSEFVPWIYHQGMTNSCTAHAMAMALVMRELQAGLPVESISRRYLYWYSRWLHGAQRVDLGSFLRTMCKGVFRWGAPDEAIYPWSENYIQLIRQPSMAAMAAAHPRRGGSYTRIWESGAERVKAIQAALSAGRPVVFGTSVGEAFLDNDGPLVADKPIVSSIVGGHAMTLCDYDSNYRYAGSSQLVFRAVNSWGEDWRDNGFVYLTEDYIRWTDTRDLWIVDGWDRLRTAA